VVRTINKEYAQSVSPPKKALSLLDRTDFVAEIRLIFIYFPDLGCVSDWLKQIFNRSGVRIVLKKFNF